MAGRGEPVTNEPKPPCCPQCSEPVFGLDANWCEACGAGLGANTDPDDGVVCAVCGEGKVDADRYCMSCGFRQPAPRELQVRTAHGVAGATDRGLVRQENQDAVAVGAANGVSVLVVCDGVATTPRSAELATYTANFVCDRIVAIAEAAETRFDASAAIVESVVAAQPTTQQRQSEDPVAAPVSDPPSTTIVVAVVAALGQHEQDEAGSGDAVRLTVGWLGDSRAYWVEPGSAHMVTVDHEVGGALTRWVGSDSTNPAPEVASQLVHGPGTIVVCSDGLWRYANDAVQFASLVHEVSVLNPQPEGLSVGLIDYARQCGAHDNVTVAVCTTPNQTSGRLTEEEQT